MTVDQGMPPRTTDIETALGRMVYQAASLEMVMRFAGEMLAATDRESDALARMTAGSLMTEVTAIASRRTEITPAECTELGNIIADARAPVESRNTYIHGAWGEVDGILLALNRRPRNQFRTRPLAVPDLEKLTAELQALVNRTMEWTYTVLQKTHPHIFTGDERADT